MQIGQLFDETDYVGIHDGSNHEIPGGTGITLGFSVWTAVQECNNRAVTLGDGDWDTIQPLAKLETFRLPEDTGEVEVGHVEHEPRPHRSQDRLELGPCDFHDGRRAS